MKLSPINLSLFNLTFFLRLSVYHIHGQLGTNLEPIMGSADTFSLPLSMRALGE